ncbi:PspC domain-containing protein [Aureibaculum marinum]|uniref:PspC domain-containing protein n=1 Tax=Aureibaculum marinum TaxID=2487930 RepID=A0A3N4PK76_9FLAO|nr:PspC domain-containing protein [Aureibaculum marinum]RPE00014.1 PspC domain-containing protein [Aureibaculum marinum]
MNKTININLGGIFFHIDEVAYQKLKRYLDAIRRSLSDDPQGRDEIINDIESRISELLSERVKDPRQVISESDIDEIIAVMGQPEDYMIDEELFTDDSGKNYSSKSSNKKLFRDGEDKFIGGVASGMAHYFDVDAIWIRIAWLVAIFGFGVGPIVYIILWILLPEAKTTAEKLQMEGEAVNISNIEKKIRAEFEDVSESVKGAASEVSDAVKGAYDNVSNAVKKKDLKTGGKRVKSGLQTLIQTIGNIISALFMVIGKFIGVVVIVVSIIALIALVISLFTAGTFDFMGVDGGINTNFDTFNVTGVPFWIISLLILILIGIPLLMLFVLGLFILSNRTKIVGRTTKLVLFAVWIIALFAAIYLGIRQGAEFINEGTSVEKSEIAITPLDTLIIKMIDNEDLSNNNNFNHKIYFKKVLDANNQIQYYSNDVNISIRKSDSTEAYTKIYRRANGRTRLIARENAERIDYEYQQIGSSLLLNSYFLTDSKNTFRNQDLRINVFLPENQIIYFDESSRVFLNRIKTTNNMYSRDMAKHYFRMTDDGLECLDCPPPKAKRNNEEKISMFKVMDSIKKTGNFESVNYKFAGNTIKLDLDKGDLGNWDKDSISKVFARQVFYVSDRTKRYEYILISLNNFKNKTSENDDNKRSFLYETNEL